MVEWGIQPEHIQQGMQALGLLSLAMAFSATQRKTIFRRAGGACEADCDKTFSEGWMMHCHHEVPLHMGGEDEVDNGELLCVGHHALAHLALFDEFGVREDMGAYQLLLQTEERTIRYLESNE